MKKVFYTEAAYAAGLILLAIGTAFQELAGFGMSMIVAPAYILHLKVSEYLPFFTFGMAEYTLQAVLIIALAIFLRRFRFGYLFSFVTAVIYGLTLDGAMLLVSPIATDVILIRIMYLIFGLLLCSAGVMMFFKTYISPEAYELFVKEISTVKGLKMHNFKTAYDIASCVIAIALSFIFFGFGVFNGVGIGTVVCAFVNGQLIGMFSKIADRIFEFKDRFELRKYFEK